MAVSFYGEAGEISGAAWVIMGGSIIGTCVDASDRTCMARSSAVDGAQIRQGPIGVEEPDCWTWADKGEFRPQGDEQEGEVDLSKS